MSDIHGVRRAAELGIRLGEVGHRIVLENAHLRVWEVALEPGQTIDFHIHRHPYLIVSLGGGENEVETIFGDKRATNEPLGETVFIDGMRPVHKLTNRAKVQYLSRLIELKHISWEVGDAPLPTREKPAAPASLPADAQEVLKEILIQTSDLQWAAKTLAGLSQKMLWRNEETGASIALVKFEKGSGIPDAHLHASNQFMYCLIGKYRYVPTGLTLTPGVFYCNPKGSVHGPIPASPDSEVGKSPLEAGGPRGLLLPAGFACYREPIAASRGALGNRHAFCSYGFGARRSLHAPHRLSVPGLRRGLGGNGAAAFQGLARRLRQHAHLPRGRPSGGWRGGGLSRARSAGRA